MVDAIAQHLAANLKRLRESRGWSQQQLADFSGVPRPTIANLESGDSNPTLSVMLRIASALGTTIEKLIASAGRRFDVVRLEAQSATSIGSALSRQLYGDAQGNAIQRIELPQKAKCTLLSSRAGMLQMITCERGRVDVAIEGEVARLKTGDLLRWQSEGEISVECVGTTSASLVLVTLPLPLGA